MRGLALVEELSAQGVKLWADGDKLRCRGPRRVMTPETVARLEEHKAAILEALEGREIYDRSEISKPQHEDLIRNTGEVLELAHARLGEMAHPEEAPYPPPEKGRDPLMHERTDKARFFRGVRKRDLEKREREGLPPRIRLVGKGAA